MSDWNDGWNSISWADIHVLEAKIEELEERIEKLERKKDIECLRERSPEL